MTYNYTIIHSKRKTMALEISRDLKIIVRAPLRTSKRDIAHMVEKHALWIDANLKKQENRLAARPELSKEAQEALRQRAKQIIPARVAFFAERMGLTPTGITITSAKKRFGSCSATNRLSFSWQLMRYPDAAVDYVVVHELAHIQEKNHSKAFYAFVAAYLPDYKARQKLLKE